MGCLGCQKAKHSPLVIRHDSLLFTILPCALEGSRRLELNAKGSNALPAYMHIKPADSHVANVHNYITKRTDSSVHFRTA